MSYSVIATAVYHHFSYKMAHMTESLESLIIIYHGFLPPPRRGSRVKSDGTHTIINTYPLAHILSVVAPFLQIIPTASCNGIPPLSR